MKNGRFLPLSIALVLFPLHLYLLTAISYTNKNFSKFDERSAVIPSPLIKITSLEFDGLASDIVYLKTLVFFGSTLTGTSRRTATDQEFQWIYRMLTVSTDLDPYFLDPYLFANATLTWEANKVRETNVLLEKGIRYRDWDYWLLFYLGFNHFYFLGENDKASYYLMEASKKPGSSPFYGHLGARLAYNSNKIENAIIFMENILETINDKTIHHDYELRLQALKAIHFLQTGVDEYKNKYGVLPTHISKLRELNIIDKIPTDPYGGEFYIDTNGAVKTTSDMRSIEKNVNSHITNKQRLTD